mmetsp:Transcript_32719/g.51025  ORF Transcript_32719/g.51025 Transcript_32719/m.51025 type:complete len:167 (-) Transcript_32719:88-588(-)|eukprot:CAMPEP_0184297714 /NCGR_PEP_ID=MMETSP1049-20130417/8586_1 /TAXON_ID=77928 /ORGANISM="Proteomonas sulcata, Strain CCMP704" /LENGTH=166 /DNA_ID=CAMNT_0026607559 /DNA_START=541 /DNA_END=1041 /DNA_ORIENTATION=-
MLAVSIVRNRGAEDGKKDTLRNIDDTGEFVVNIMSEWFVESANHSCGPFRQDVDEFHEAGLTPLTSSCVQAPRVGESAVHYECKVHRREDFQNKQGVTSTTMVLGEVVRVHVAQECLDMNGAGDNNPIVKTDVLQPMGRLGGNTYCRIGSTFDMARPNGSLRSTVS